MSQRREFSDLIWEVVKNRGCDEIAIRYDCGHAIRADVLAPSLPRTQEYGTQDLERRRFTQHCIYVLTKDPSATKLQITVPEGRCGHCHRGNRQVLLCGLLQMDLTEERDSRTKIAPSPRLELPLTSHSFMAAMGQVCKLPENITPPPLQESQGSIRLFDAPPLPREEPMSRKEIEDQLKAEVMKYVGGATCLLLTTVVAGVYFFIKRMSLSTNYDAINATMGIDVLEGEAAVDPLQADISNSTWMLSLTLPFFKLFGGSKGSSFNLWSIFVSPIHSLALLFQYVILRPTIMLSQIPMTTPLIVATVFSLLVAALSAPQPLSLSLPSLWVDLSSIESTRTLWSAIVRSKTFGPMAQRLQVLLSSRKEKSQQGGKGGGGAGGTRGGVGGGSGNAVGGARGGQKGDKPEKAGRADVPGGRPDRLTPGQKEGRAPSGSSSTAPACFVCLDRPSRYVLEPCGHRVVCQQCAAQLVEAAVRNRSVSDAAGGGASQCGGGACPSCGMAITRAMRLFS